MRKQFLFRLISFLSIFLIYLIGGEIYARVKHGEVLGLQTREASYRQADFQFHHSLVPNARSYQIKKEWAVPYSINSFGLRDQEYLLKKPSNTFRILVLGDSFTEGHGARQEHTFVKILEKKLNQASKSSFTYEVINGGIGGYSPLLEYLFLSKKALRLEPDMVIICYDVSDLYDDYEYEKTTFFNENGRPLKCIPYKRIRPYSFNPLERFLMKHSLFYAYIENRINKKLFKMRYGLKRGKELDGFLVSGEGNKALVRLRNKIKDEEELDGMIALREGKKQIQQRLWEKNKKYLELIFELLRNKGIGVVLVKHPNPIEVSEFEWTEGRLLRDFEAGKVYGQAQVVTFLAQLAKEKKVPFINLYPYFEESDVFPLYYEFDGHFTENGHRLMGEALFDNLIKMELVNLK